MNSRNAQLDFPPAGSLLERIAFQRNDANRILERVGTVKLFFENEHDIFRQLGQRWFHLFSRHYIFPQLEQIRLMLVERIGRFERAAAAINQNGVNRETMRLFRHASNNLVRLNRKLWRMHWLIAQYCRVRRPTYDWVEYPQFAIVFHMFR